MAGKNGNGGIGKTPLHNKGDGGIKTMAGTVMFPGLQEFRGKAGKGTQKGLMNNFLDNQGVKISKSGGMIDGGTDVTQEKLSINKHYTGKAMELAKKLGAIDEEGNFIKASQGATEGYMVKVFNSDNNVIVNIFNYPYNAAINITTENIFGEEMTNNKGIEGSRILRGDELHELLSRVLK